MSNVTSDIAARLWNLCNVLKDDGVIYHQQVTALTYSAPFRERFEAVLNTLAESRLIGHVDPELDTPGHSSRHCVVMQRFIIVYKPTVAGGFGLPV